jgi:hypothetical protein
MMEEDHRNILIIGGIQIFLPSSPVEARVCVADATTEEGQPTVTVIEEMEQMLISSPTEEEHAVKMFTPWEKELEMLEDWLNNPEPVDDFHEKTIMHIVGEEHSTELLRSFSQEVEQEMTAALKPATEDESEFQSEEQLEEAGDEPTEELAEASLSEEEVEQQLSNETAEMEFAAGWQAKATGDGENNKGDQDDPPIDKEELQQNMKHKESQPLEQLDREIEEIRRLMLRSATETASEEKLSRRKPAIAAGRRSSNNNKAVEQMDNSKEQFGIQVDFNRAWEAHEQELMNFSQQWSMMQEHRSNPATCQLDNTSSVHSRKGEAPTLSF